MKIRSNVKAGGSSCQHNEKMANDDINAIDQKKNFGRKLRLNKETIRNLEEGGLNRIAGGAALSGIICTQTCYDTTCGHTC